MDDLELIILGSASGLPEANKTHASLALRRSDDIWLLDAGEGVCSSLLSSRLDPQNLRGIYITHCHPDHCVGIFMVLQYLHMTDYRGQIDIYLPGGAINAFQGFMDQLYFIRGVINPRYELRPLEASHRLDGDITLETFRTKHLTRWEKLNLSSIETAAYAFRVITSNCSLFYSGDVDSFDDIADVLQSGELLILEAAHIEIESILEYLAGLNLRRLVLTHALPEQGRRWDEYTSLAQKHGIDLIVASDGLKIPL